MQILYLKYTVQKGKGKSKWTFKKKKGENKIFTLQNLHNIKYSTIFISKKMFYGKNELENVKSNKNHAKKDITLFFCNKYLNEMKH